MNVWIVKQMLTTNQVLKNLANSQENTWVGKKKLF